MGENLHCGGGAFEDFLISQSKVKIEYMNRYDTIELDEPSKLFEYTMSSKKFKIFENIRPLLNDDEFEIFIDKCIDINRIDKNEERCLIHYVCSMGDAALQLVQHFNEAGADLATCRDGNYRYPIHYACYGGDNSIELVKYLVAQGADVNCSDLDWTYPLHIACGLKAPNLVKYLIENGANVDRSDLARMYPIHYACYGGDDSLQVVKLLVEYDIAVIYQENFKKLPIHIACMGGNGSIELVKYLVANGAKLDQYAKQIVDSTSCAWLLYDYIHD